MKNTSKYKFVPLSNENIHELIPLYRSVFNVKYSLKQIKAKYQPTYTGIYAQGHFAFHKGKAVAFHGAIPILMRHKNEVELCAQYGDAMTLEQHIGNGLFTKLGELTDEALNKKDVRFVWGFPNQNSEYGYVNKLHWEGKERMQCYILKLNSLSSEVVYRKTKILERKNQKRIKSALAPLTIEKKNLHSINTINYGGVDRSDSFYDYKSFSPNYFIQLNESKVWVKPLGGLLVGDMEVKDKSSALKTVEDLKLLAKSLGLNKVVFQTSPKSELNSILNSIYRPIDSWLIGYKNFHSNFPLDKLQFTYGDLDTF